MIDYDGLPSNDVLTKPRLASALAKPNRPAIKVRKPDVINHSSLFSAFQPPMKPKLINPNKMIYVHVKTLNEGQQFVSFKIDLFPDHSLNKGFDGYDVSQSTRINLS